SGRLRRAQQRAERADQVEPPQRERKEAVERAHQPELLLEATGLVEPTEQVEQRVDLAVDIARVTELSISRRLQKLVGLLHLAGDRVRALLELLDRCDRSRALVRGLVERLPEGGRPFGSVFALRLVLSERARAPAYIEAVVTDLYGRGLRGPI